MGTKPDETTPGRTWRVLAHEDAGPVELKNRGTFDELVVDDWFHMEQLDARAWWMKVGDMRVLVTLSPDTGVVVEVERGFYAPVNGTTVSGDT
ncbi:hypothetical protein ACQKGO_14230 [Corallococcus interemptor]|uniref:hypothetical protein n=1 Tax=Corallococcus interemptor TaxID=2316720 RepID=UPI003CFC1F3F